MPRQYRCRIETTPIGITVTAPECWAYRHPKRDEVYMSVVINDGTRRQRITVSAKLPNKAPR